MNNSHILQINLEKIEARGKSGEKNASIAMGFSSWISEINFI